MFDIVNMAREQIRQVNQQKFPLPFDILNKKLAPSLSLKQNIDLAIKDIANGPPPSSLSLKEHINYAIAKSINNSNSA